MGSIKTATLHTVLVCGVLIINIFASFPANEPFIIYASSAFFTTIYPLDFIFSTNVEI